jgi:hypothetical protein
MSEPEVTLYPAWKQAVEDFIGAGFNPGDLVPHSWLADHFGMPQLSDAMTMTPSEYRDRQFTWLAHVECFKSALLEDHQIFLQSVYGEGYRWVPPQEQTGVAVKTFEREARRVYRQAGMRLTNVRADELTDEQRRENADQIGRLSMLQGMHRAIK